MVNPAEVRAGQRLVLLQSYQGDDGVKRWTTTHVTVHSIKNGVIYAYMTREAKSFQALKSDDLFYNDTEAQIEYKKRSVRPRVKSPGRKMRDRVNRIEAESEN